jgi:hypothetical protein
MEEWFILVCDALDRVVSNGLIPLPFVLEVLLMEERQ